VKVSLDTNVLVYAVHADDRRNQRAVNIVARAGHGQCILSMQSLAECFDVLTKKRHMEPKAAAEEIGKLRRSFEIYAACPSDLDDAMQVVTEHTLSVWDAMLWATCRRAGCVVILSEDMQDGRELLGVTFINPFDPKNDAAIERVFAESEDFLP